MNLKSSFVQFLNQKYPQIGLDHLETMISEQLLSPFHVVLSNETFQQLQTEITGYEDLRSWSQNHLQSTFENKGIRQPVNTAVCTSYDFHINDQGQPKLIEINTNAAFLALGLELYEFHQHKPETNFDEQQMIAMFTKEMALCGAITDEISILDEKPSEQRLFIEFLIYKSIFEKHKIKTHIFDINEISQAPTNSLVYNRYTDFYLSEPKSAQLKNLFNDQKIHLSPHPYEYFLLADKQRMADWNKQTEFEKPQSLLKIYDLGCEDKDIIWSERKKLFFKPKTSFGSKQAYKGANIRRKTFDELFGQDFIAQEYVMPSEIDVTIDGLAQKLKYDLRCYAYEGKLQLIVARLYQGQATNLRTPSGGFAIVKIN